MTTKSQESQLALQEAQLTTAQPSFPQLVKGLMEQGLSPEALGKALEVWERMEAKSAEKAFDIAFRELQAETPRIKALKAVPDRNGKTKFTYAPYEAIMDEVQPLLEKHGFTVRFDTDFAESRVISICHLSHAGHTKSTKYAVRIGDGPPGASTTQADGAAYSYAKRGALCATLNITIERGGPDADDARTEGVPLSADQIGQLKALTNGYTLGMDKFFKWLAVESIEEIPSAKFQRAKEQLQKHQKDAPKQNAQGEYEF